MTEEVKDSIIDLKESSPQTSMRGYHYTITKADGKLSVTVVAPSSSMAREAISNHFPGLTLSYIGKSETVIVCNV